MVRECGQERIVHVACVVVVAHLQVHPCMSRGLAVSLPRCLAALLGMVRRLGRDIYLTIKCLVINVKKCSGKCHLVLTFT